MGESIEDRPGGENLGEGFDERATAFCIGNLQNQRASAAAIAALTKETSRSESRSSHPCDYGISYPWTTQGGLFIVRALAGLLLRRELPPVDDVLVHG